MSTTICAQSVAEGEWPDGQPSPAPQKALTAATMSQSLRSMEYAVRGSVVMRAEQIEQQLAQGAKLPFEKITFANIGNPQAVGQKPITFFRQVRREGRECAPTRQHTVVRGMRGTRREAHCQPAMSRVILFVRCSRSATCLLSRVSTIRLLSSSSPETPSSGRVR